MIRLRTLQHIYNSRNFKSPLDTTQITDHLDLSTIVEILKVL